MHYGCLETHTVCQNRVEPDQPNIDANFDQPKKWAEPAQTVCLENIGLSRLNPFYFRIKMILKIVTQHQMDPIGTFHSSS